MKLTAKQKKEVAALVKAAKQSDGALKWQDLYDQEAAAWEGDGARLPIITAVIHELGEWSKACRDSYTKLAEDVQAIDKAESEARGEVWGLYLWDESVDHMNVTSDGTGPRTEQSVDYWSAMEGCAGFCVGSRAHDAGIDINARLGRCIY